MFIKRILILSLLFLLIWVTWLLLHHSSFTEITNIEPELKIMLNRGPDTIVSNFKLSFKPDYKLFFPRECAYKDDYKTCFWYRPITQYGDSNILIFTSDPFSLTAGGVRSFFPLKSTEVRIVKTIDLSELKSLLFFNIKINRIVLYQDTLFFRYDRDRYGKKFYEL